MVRVVDLDDEGTDPDDGPLSHRRRPAATTNGESLAVAPNRFAAILACYPVAIELAAVIDLNTLHDLSRTCHAIRSTLLQFRNQLRTRTLQCSNEALVAAARAGPSGAAQDAGGIAPFAGYQSWNVQGSYGVAALRITSPKVGPCARDLVSECRRCGRVVCRNCIMKPPPLSRRPRRLRRLCPACIRAPLALLLPTVSPTVSGAPCSCPHSVFICQPCGHAFSHADVNYQRIWTWRTRYSTYLGGLGTGIGEGHEGVQCGRDEHCVAAQDVEVEVDGREAEAALAALEAGEGPSGNEEDAGPAAHDPPESDEEEEDPWTWTDFPGVKAGYLRQEIEGCGGVVRTKFKRRVRVGAIVHEHEDERASGTYLRREARGEVRAWCGWCERVVLGERDGA